MRIFLMAILPVLSCAPQVGSDAFAYRLDARPRAHGRQPPTVLTCVATAFNKLSLVKGFVRYWSDPTIRPRARSKSPSFEDSITTGVVWNFAFFLISAQV